MRTSTIERTTNETTITLTLTLDGTGQASIETPIPFLNHMLEAFTFYSKVDLQLQAQGDLIVDDHHLVEDIGIVLGQALQEALGDKNGIQRFASAFTPMDEALSRVVLDISNRPKLVFEPSFQRDKLGNLSLENIYEFFYAFTMEARITLHLAVLYGNNDHHKVEALFKGLGRVVKDAIQIQSKDVTSTKGVL